MSARNWRTPHSMSADSESTNTILVTDSRSGKVYTLDLERQGILHAKQMANVHLEEGKSGVLYVVDAVGWFSPLYPYLTVCFFFSLRMYDPGYFNTACCKSAITFIDGDRGLLRYRGYPIEQLAEKCTFLEVAFLLINGQLPNKPQLEEWNDTIMKHTYMHQNLTELMRTFRYVRYSVTPVASISFLFLSFSYLSSLSYE
jgi:hypothetical protein